MIKRIIDWCLYKLRIKKYTATVFPNDVIGMVIGTMIFSIVQEIADKEYRKLGWRDRILTDFYTRCQRLRKALIGY